MKKGFARHVAVALAAAGTMGLMSTTANAQAVRFTGTTTGCFVVSGSSCTGMGSSTFEGLTYNGSAFSANSNANGGLFTLGNNPGTGVGGTNFNNLGSFTLTDGTHNYSGQQFRLFLNFTAPTGVKGDSMYTAMLLGNLTGQANGNVFIDFVNTAHNFTFSNGTTLNFAVNNLSVDDQQNNTATVSVTGQGVATVPEPSSMALLGTGLVGLVPMVRRRKNKA